MARVNIDLQSNLKNFNTVAEAKQKESNTMNRRKVEVQLWDLDIALDVAESFLGSFEVVTEDDDNTVIQQVLMEEDVKEFLTLHNKMRVERVNLDILNRTGSSVKLQPVKLKHLTWKVLTL